MSTWTSYAYTAVSYWGSNEPRDDFTHSAGGGLVTPQEIAPRFRVQEAGEGVYDPQEMLNQGLLIREDHI